MNPSAPTAQRLTVPCPTCGQDSLYAPENPHRPFCCERCKNVDFGAWASESYRVDASSSAQDRPEDEPGLPH